MNTFKYRVFYQWDGRTESDPFAKEKNQHEIERAFEYFPNEVWSRLNDKDAEVKTSKGKETNCVQLHIRTVDSPENVEMALTATLQDWSLYCEKLADSPR